MFKGQNFHCASICRKTFAFASKQLPQVPKHFEVRGKTSRFKQTETAKVLVLECFALYGNSCHGNCVLLYYTCAITTTVT